MINKKEEHKNFRFFKKLSKFEKGELYDFVKRDEEIEKGKTVTLTVEEHQFLVEELGENRSRSQELLDDEIISNESIEPETRRYFEGNIEGYKREVRLFDSILKKL
tara:strand:+ start:937 stop:1254 length:318 start_codon:yes stop_codon:yes gene_type:complete